MSSKGLYERFIWFDHKVRAKAYPNATKIAGHFEVSVKTAQRDIEFMRDRLNCPLIYDKTRKGYFYENGTFSLPLTHLSSEELSSLLIAKKILQGISGGGMSGELSMLIDKITALLSKNIAEAAIIDKAFSLQLVEYSPAPEDIFRKVLTGCLKRRSLSFEYKSPLQDEKSRRTVDP